MRSPTPDDPELMAAVLRYAAGGGNGPGPLNIRHPSSDDPELMTAIRRYVHAGGNGADARYMQLMGAHFMRMDKAQRGSFLQQLGQSAREASDHDLAMLLDSEWRSRITASWLIGLDRRDQFRERIGDLLLASELCVAGQGYCLALARFAAAADAELLAAYLDAYLPPPYRDYDQASALGALLYLDEQLKTDHAARFLTDGGLWQQWTAGRPVWTPAEHREFMRQLCSAADEAMDTG
jgi:hypothetical protein